MSRPPHAAPRPLLAKAERACQTAATGRASSMSESLTITSGKVVALHYTLRDDGGVFIDGSSGGDPLYYLHGAENLVPGLESALEGHAIGDKLSVIVPP